jgi:hypothetical protein
VSVRARPVSRRTAVGAALAGTLAGSGLVTGCTPDAPTADPAGGTPTEAEPDADVVLLGTVLAALDATAALVSATSVRHPRLASVLQPLLDVHAAHRAVLDEAAEVDQDDADAPAVAPRPDPALDRARRAEARLVGTLRDATATAQSGDFARALASMVASLSQHLTVLGTARSTA